MRTALTLAAVTQGEVRLLGVYYQQQVYSSTGLQLCLLCVCKLILLFSVIYYLMIIVNSKLVAKQAITNSGQ